jgi:hypothetical protein
MSERTLKLHGNRMRHQFVGSSFNAVFQDTRLHDAWWQVDTLIDEINTRYQHGEDIKTNRAELLRVVGKEYHERSIEDNTFVCDSSSDGRRRLQLFRYDFKAREGGKEVKYDFFQVTALTVPPSYPTASNSGAWKEQNASKPLPPRTRQHMDFTSSTKQFCDGGLLAAANKRQKCDDGHGVDRASQSQLQIL